MLEIRLEQKQSDLASVRGDDLHFACTSEIRSPPGDVAALVEPGHGHLLYLCWLVHSQAPSPV